MAIKRICSIEGCGKDAKGRIGLCHAHYAKLRIYGDPTAGKVYRPAGAAVALFEQIMLSNVEECIFWPYIRSPKGYAILPAMPKDHRSRFASKVMCERIHGPAPSSQHQAAHECGNGHLGCINPRHIFWKTPIENSLDRVNHRIIGKGRWAKEPRV